MVDEEVDTLFEKMVELWRLYEGGADMQNGWWVNLKVFVTVVSGLSNTKARWLIWRLSEKLVQGARARERWAVCLFGEFFTGFITKPPIKRMHPDYVVRRIIWWFGLFGCKVKRWWEVAKSFPEYF